MTEESSVFKERRYYFNVLKYECGKEEHSYLSEQKQLMPSSISAEVRPSTAENSTHGKEKSSALMLCV